MCLVARSCATPWTVARQLLCPWHSPGWNTGVSSRSLRQGIFPTQGSKPGLPLCGQILYQLSHQGSPRILERVAYPFSRASSPPRNGTRVYRIAGGFLGCPCAGPAKSQLAQRFASPQPRALEGLRQRAVPRGERARGRPSSAAAWRCILKPRPGSRHRSKTREAAAFPGERRGRAAAAANTPRRCAAGLLLFSTSTWCPTLITRGCLGEFCTP